MQPGTTRSLLRTAGVLGIVSGAGFGAFGVAGAIHLAQGRGILYPFGSAYPTYGRGPLEHAGVPTTPGLIAAFVAACAVQLIGGILLLRPNTGGIATSLLGIAICAVFWWGFLLPFGFLLGAAQIALIAAGWRGRRSRRTGR